MKTTFSILIALLTAVQLSAQCRLVRMETSDTSSTRFYYYDKQGRLSSEKGFKTISGKKLKSDIRYAYNDKNKLAAIQDFQNDTLSIIRNLIYDNDVIKQVWTIWADDTTVSIGQFYYNEKGQVVRLVDKTKNRDTFSVNYEYAPEGWLKSYIYLSSYPDNNGKEEIYWNADQKIINPNRVFFPGYPFMPNNGYAPIEPLSVKGNWKSRIQYKLDKEGKFIKGDEHEVFDVKGNAEGLWTEDKHRIIGKDKIVTYRGFYEGCKN